MKKICLAGVASLSLLGIPALADEVDPLADIYACANIADDSARLACFDTAVSATQVAQQAGEFRTLTRQDTERVQEDAFGFSLPSLPSFRLPSIGREANALADAVPNETPAAVAEAPATPEPAPGPTPVETSETAQQRPAPPTVAEPEPERPQNVVRDDEGDIEAVTLQIARINRGAYDKLTIYFRNGQVWRQIDSEIVRLRSSNPPRTATIRRAALGSYLMQFDDRGRAIRVRREE
ncbi:hypothetical protein [Ponticaulis sp.]|uniref:hypothetical protein n=1 Tax=Ponticaulis sp. TaxID=2020902 RepID=UPI000B673DBB|nr:hypothetical protein [Ponticaulis sp.]MAJ08855.1 hypothetical protein [Ponticaulis sp.]RPG17545.1 MAG: hypothetical protein CBC85_006195 [Hyphomonadaceae bacterium TMED125]HBJ92411.1 hypothetical protein [Hyphomonadaceae bacterium]|tara:strand:+ start:11403 stop:12113 length:711 start_codon:yes stop_codon:yes gene_type:complete